MEAIGTRIFGIRLPIISEGDDLQQITVDHALHLKENGIALSKNDIIGITESIVAKAQGNYASIEDIEKDIENKFSTGDVGLVFPMPSRNRFLGVMKGIARNRKKVYVLLQFPFDEVGNPLVDITKVDSTRLPLISAAEYQAQHGSFAHPLTGMDYVSLFEDVGDNIEVYFSSDPTDILKLTKNVLVCNTHGRLETRDKLLNSGADKVYMLSDILTEPIEGSGYNPEYGLMGSNLSTSDTVKLFPRDSAQFVAGLVAKFTDELGFSPEILIYGDGAYKDPSSGIWELADPVVSPAYTEKLSGYPVETKLKYIADNLFGDLDSDKKRHAVSDYIKSNLKNKFNDGTTPRRYSDLVGSLCDLVSGSGEKGTPVILIQGYFDHYATSHADF